MKSLLRAVAVVSLVAFSACGPQTRTEKIAALTGNTSNGATLYTNQCAACHGADGKGTAAGKSLVEPAKNDAKTEIIDTLINGIAGTAMVSYASLTDQQLADLATYVKTTFAN